MTPLRISLATAGLWWVLQGLAWSQIRPLAQDYVVVAKSPDPAQAFLYNPSILRLDSGRLAAYYEYGGKFKQAGQGNAFIATSDDGGKTWQTRANFPMSQARLFTAGKAVYLIGHRADLQILRSDDNGTTWTAPISLVKGSTWHQTAANVWHANGKVYLVMEKRVGHEIKSWLVGELAPVLMRASEKADLTKLESWTFASELPFCEVIPGYKDNRPQIDFFGVPFFPPNYPGTTPLAYHRSATPIGWLETNVVQILDPDHYWYDPTGHTFHLFMRAHTGGTGYAAMAKVVENADGTMTTSLEKAPSGKEILYLPFPGGQMRFHVLYDEQTKLYWLLGSQATDSMTRADRLPADRFDLPNNERNRLVLYFSKNMVDWCFAGLVAKGATQKESRHYASMDIDGNDLVILSRSGDAEAASAHNGDIITFHRVKNFRDLVY